MKNASENLAGLNKKIGKRLNALRTSCHYTQEELAEKAHCEPAFISLLENGKRNLTQQFAIILADIFDVNVNYLLCRSDIAEKIDYAIRYDWPADPSDKLLVLFLISQGISFSFRAIKTHDMKPPRKTQYDTFDFSSIEEEIDIADIENFSFDEPHCMVSKKGFTSEMLIVKVIINGKTLSFGQSYYFFKRMYDYIGSSIYHIDTFLDDLNTADIIDTSNRIELDEIRSHNTFHEILKTAPYELREATPEDYENAKNLIDENGMIKVYQFGDAEMEALKAGKWKTLEEEQ